MPSITFHSLSQDISMARQTNKFSASLFIFLINKLKSFSHSMRSVINDELVSASEIILLFRRTYSIL